MGLFGEQAKPAGRMESQFISEEPEEETRPVPELLTPRTNTVIAKGITLSGALQGEGIVQVEGTVEGEVNLKGSIIVTSTGLIKGPVEADSVRIAGCVEGNITAHDHLRLERTGTIDGDVSTVSFVIEDGGRLNGRSTMVKAQKKPLPIPETLSQENLQFGRNYSGLDGEEEEAAQV